MVSWYMICYHIKPRELIIIKHEIYRTACAETLHPRNRRIIYTTFIIKLIDNQVCNVQIN